MTFLELTQQLVGILPGLSPFLAERHINDAWRTVCESRLWSFLTADGAVNCPAQIVTGTVAFTQFGVTVVANATASAALLAAPTNPGLTKCQIRFAASGGNTPVVGQLYQILEVDATTPTAVVLSLDRPIFEATATASAYQVYRAYIVPPVADFKSWLSLVDVAQGWRLRLGLTSAYFDARDPQRMSQGQAAYIGFFQAAQATQTDLTTGSPIYELWPHPTQGQQFYVRLRRRGEPFTAPLDELPDQISSSLIIHHALGYHSYPWAGANIGHFPALKGPGWTTLALEERRMAIDELNRLKIADNEQAEQQVWNRGHGLRRGRGIGRGSVSFPIDAAFIQGHLLNF